MVKKADENPDNSQETNPGAEILFSPNVANLTDPISSSIEKPDKVMRIGSMVKQLLSEVKDAPLDEAGRERLKNIFNQSITELSSGLSPDLQKELKRVTIPFTEKETPSESELRIAQASLVGWLEGLFHGIQTALIAEHMTAQAKLEQLRSGNQALPEKHHSGGTGQYL